MLRPKNKKAQKSEIQVIPLKDCLAKTIRLTSGSKPGISVETHCLIVGYVARELLNRMPGWLRDNLFPKGSELIAAAHDLGKVSPTFQEKIYFDIGKSLEIIDRGLDKEIGGHAAVSQASVNGSPRYIPEILGRHHGYNSQSVGSPDAEVYGGCNWQKQRIELLNALKKYLKVDWPVVSSALHSDILAGLTTVADWIASGSLFDELGRESWKGYISESLDRAGFVVPKIRKKLDFADIFDFAPRNIQTIFIEAIKAQGAYVLEAPMGIGKTEAALFAAYQALEEGRAKGIYFALPTQLTSDKVHERMNAFLAKILDENNVNQRSLLLHSSAWLSDTEMGADGAPGHSWFNSSKRGLLAPFAVGTIDQALMAVMNVKHGFVRTFGLAGKVVILDEVHSYDNYTGTILKELVNALRQLHCTVIILSATLTDSQKYSILDVSRKEVNFEKTFSAYPLVSAYPSEGELREIEAGKTEDYKIAVYMSSNDDEAVDEVLLRAEKGEQILWVENTVYEAQNLYCLLAAKSKEVGVDCGLLHSRFLKIDRRKNEDKWVNVFGKTGRNARQEKGRILVGTQVLEQSLDIDADFLVTRLCPTDMIFQRLGRLWRHRENDDIRPKEANREVRVLSPNLKDAIYDKHNIGKSAMVYSPYVLCRTLEVWQNISSVDLPGGIRPLLEATYKERPEEGNFAKYKYEMEQIRDKLHREALVGVSRGGKTLPESKATTRYSEIESVDVLLLKEQPSVKSEVLLRFLDDSELSLPKFTDAATRRKIAIKLLNNTVSVPEYLSPIARTKQIKWLKDYVYLGDYEESPFRAAIVQDSGELQGLGCSTLSDKYKLNYNSCLGYRAQTKGGGEDDE